MIIGESEGLAAKLRSILAQLDYCYHVCDYDTKGIPFKTYLYVPEIHPDTKMPFYEREDEAHLLKVVILS